MQEEAMRWGLGFICFMCEPTASIGLLPYYLRFFTLEKHFLNLVYLFMQGTVSQDPFSLSIHFFSFPKYKGTPKYKGNHSF